MSVAQKLKRDRMRFGNESQTAKLFYSKQESAIVSKADRYYIRIDVDLE